ncbi:hypothetical protein BJF85_02760 [Saccharomonospora sp. CUA-673]|uniref:DUF3099 domain-containing protein n=1 Tax=Saccharomonospora sp. CUA-673 TaxID=1904969 RepID=UPI000960E2AD|nr:DUF3099 domain-containing protein [Saccharomonospora sp. CUA-673]OLT43042.1 hypothetical protein BJF85_02760 [Saccharomonospora sp. CUA-673]
MEVRSVSEHSTAGDSGDRSGDPVLITEAAPSYDDELADRKRKYFITMSFRFPCLILAGVFYQTWWLAVAILLLSVPLPWIAVLIANDRPPRKAEEVNKYRRQHRAIEATPEPALDPTHQVIDVSAPASGATEEEAASGRRTDAD